MICWRDGRAFIDHLILDGSRGECKAMPLHPMVVLSDRP